MKRLFIVALLVASVFTVSGQSQDEYKFSLVPRRLAVPSLTGYLKADGTVPLTADWDAGEYGITALNLTADPTLGAEINTGFASWTAAAGWTYGSGKWTHSSGTTALTDDQSALFSTSKSYKIVVVVTHAGTGGVSIAVGGTTFEQITASGTYIYYCNPSATTRLTATPTTGFTGSIDSVSIVERTNGTITNGSFNFSGSQMFVPTGSYTNPSIVSSGDTDTGIYFNPLTIPGIAFSVGGALKGFFYTGGFYVYSGNLYFGSSGDLHLVRKAAATLQLGNDAAATVAQTLKAHDGSGTDIAGASLSLKGGQSTGTGTPGSVILNVGTTSTTGSSVNAYQATPAATIALDGITTWQSYLNDATGNEAAFTLNYTTNKSSSGNDTGLLINQTDTASPGTSYLIDAQVGGTSKFSVDNAGALSVAGSINYATAGYGVQIGTGTIATSGRFNLKTGGNHTESSGTGYCLWLNPTWNQTSTAGGIDLLINRTETAVGSGTHRLISAQVGSVERVGFDNKGFETRAYPLACTHDTATALFGITVAAGSTAGGIITYTLNVTDDDGSDDQIEVGTVQFCGLQDEANWHTNISEVSTQALESGTLATTWAIDTATANTLKVTLQATSNLTSPVYTLSYTVTWNNSYTVTTY